MKNNYVYPEPVLVDDEDAEEPVTVDEAKTWAKIDIDTDDAIILDLITTARIQCERYLNISLIPRTVTAYLINELGNILLPYQPFTGDDFESIIDTDGNDISTDNYTLYGGAFKRLKTCFNCQVTVTYMAGYTAETLPKPLKTAILNQVVWNEQHRGDDSAQPLSPEAIIKMNQFRKVK